MLSGDDIKGALNVGPVGVTVNCENSQFIHYKSGIFNCPNSECSAAYSDLNHTVLLVGYGNEDGTDYFISKNEWGTSWGEEGYMKIANIGSGYGIVGVNNEPVIATSNYNRAEGLIKFAAATVSTLAIVLTF